MDADDAPDGSQQVVLYEERDDIAIITVHLTRARVCDGARGWRSTQVRLALGSDSQQRWL